MSKKYSLNIQFSKNVKSAILIIFLPVSYIYDIKMLLSKGY